MEKPLKPDRKYLIKGIWIFVTVSAIFALLAAIIHLIVYLVDGDMQASEILWIVILAIILALWVIGYTILYFWYKNLEYRIYEDRVCIHKGILTKTQQNIPFRAITDFALVRTLYDRFLDIGSIKIQTAGKHISSSSQYEGNLAGLINYEQLHTELRERVKKLHPVSGTVTTRESEKPADTDLWQEMLKELKEIRMNTGR
ncbi:MAG: PH domain-containing protein [Bacteroidales bacterium]